ncbi:MAG TPA: polysaccharide pyruvyl transferase family protein, partial [Polyangiales bacterium]|nr:polysaccharide pyruvyl transferase family protein [Polyangiales bacterium]
MRRLWERLTDPDRALQVAMGGLIEAAGMRYALDVGQRRYRPGEPLKLLLAGYVGTRNTGADVRVEEMIRQFRAIFGDDNLELSALTIDPALSAGYFRTVRQVHLPPVFPKFLFEECPKHDGVIACEGSMFKSKFANALSTMMAGALGMASVEGKLSVGYGAEAGAMDDSLHGFVRRQAGKSLVICRNEPSRKVLEGMGIRTKGGTDTAWTFEPAAPQATLPKLMAAGWDGRRPLVIVCPINPFYWPAKPDVVKALALRGFGQFREEHYDSIYFHTWSEEAEDRYEAYLDGLAEAVTAFAQEQRAFVALVGMERLDRAACEALAQRLPERPPLFVSDEHDMYTLVSILRHASLLVSSRYHAIVTSMPGGVPSVGVTMDERIHNLLHDRGHADLLLRVDDDGLGHVLLRAMRGAWGDRDRVRAEI